MLPAHTMSKAASSPTARLLQSSRLFSLPRPLPQPALESITSTGQYRASDTATRPYPTHQAIATPSSSHHRGDWGLKRALPAKATKSSTPHIRVSAQDTSEHITDFGSAADHTQTAARWREMGVPMLYKQRKTAAGEARKPPVSVFEESVDHTDARQQKQRWKYAGPWIAGMQDGEFNLYTRQLEKRKDEWREFVRSHIVEQRLADRRRQAQDEGEVLSMHDINALRQELRPGDQELVEIEKEMRDNHAMEGLSSELTALIASFLDLPSVLPTGTENNFSISAQTPLLQKLVAGLKGATDSEDTIPPSTHPSAGLSYLRTNAVMFNHPLHGPQAHASPILARVVRPRNSMQGTEYQAKLGVAGVVTNDPISSTFNPNLRYADTQKSAVYDVDQMISALDIEVEGGNKIYVHPQSASVDETGRIRLDVNRGDTEAIAVKTGDVDPIHESRAASTRGPLSAAPGTAGNANYGYSLPDMRRAPEATRMPDYGGAFSGNARSSASPARAPRRPEVRGFDEELGRRPGQGRLDDESSMSRIRELMESRGRR